MVMSWRTPTAFGHTNRPVFLRCTASLCVLTTHYLRNYSELPAVDVALPHYFRIISTGVSHLRQLRQFPVVSGDQLHLLKEE